MKWLLVVYAFWPNAPSTPEIYDFQYSVAFDTRQECLDKLQAGLPELRDGDGNLIAVCVESSEDFDIPRGFR